MNIVSLSADFWGFFGKLHLLWFGFVGMELFLGALKGCRSISLVDDGLIDFDVQIQNCPL